jgi:hypothetical protein
MTETKTPRKPLKKHWYKQWIDYCVLCGRTDIVRERHYGERPKDEKDRYVYTEGACGDHFC